MNTLMKWFSLCLCLGAFVFAAPEAKSNEDVKRINPVKMKDNFLRGPSLDYEPSSRDCGETFVAFGIDPNGSYEACWSDGSGYFYFYWEGGCLALDITYAGGTLDLSTYGFTEGFYFYGFEPGETDTFTITFDDGSAGTAEGTSECTSECGDGVCNGEETYENCPADCNESGCGAGEVLDCVDDDCCPESWIGDGYADCEDQAYGCDLTCYDNDGGDCDETTTDGGTTGGTTGGTSTCDDCEFDWSAYGSECCDTAWDEFAIDCATLEGTYGWDCAGCSCPGDNGGTTGGDDGGAGGECEEGFCEEGTYWDGFSCYDCSYCIDTFDDSACDSPFDCCGMCGGSFDGGCCTADETQCWDGSCADTADDCPDQPEITTPGICAEGTELYDAPAVTVTWFIETVCGDGICNGDEDYYNCPEDCNAPGECDDGYVPDCVDDDCCPESWIGDGFEDCEDQAYGCDLTCYDNDGGDCDGSGTDGGTTGGTTGGTASCDDCEFDWSAYGSECCDTAWDEFGIDCATLEGTYGWDCAGCSCPGDGASECGDGNCTGDETYETCPEDCEQLTGCEESGGNQSWVGDGWCDTVNNNEGCGYDGGDCCPDDCGENLAAGCPEANNGAGGCYAGSEDGAYCGDCTVCVDPNSDDCVDTSDTGESRDTESVAKGVKSIETSINPNKKGAPYSTAVASAPFHGEYNGPSNREVVLNITFECVTGTNAGYIDTWAADPALGEFTVYGWGADDFVCVTAQACDGAACGDATEAVCVMAGAMDGVQECTEGGDACGDVGAGDVTLDGEVNVLDIVQIVNHILESALLTDECALGAADYTDDGEVNVLDIVQIVNIILGGRITGDATSAKLQNENGQMTIDANGYIGGIQMTLSHGGDFSIELTEKALVADYNTMGNTTKLVIVAPETDELFISVGDYTIDEMIVANSTSEVTVSMPSNIEIVGAYPNPFNPSTTVSVSVDDATTATIMAYDISGRSVGVVFDGVLDAGMTSVTWNASSLPSGAYILKLSTPDGSASMQKVMLMK